MLSLFAVALICSGATELLSIEGSQTPIFRDIVRNSDGSPKYMNQADAKTYCESEGARLPSARELAWLSMSLGSQGIVDSCGSDARCVQLQTTNADGGVDEFNFTNSGYRRPNGDYGDNWFWSSSVLSSHAYFGLYLDGVTGKISDSFNRNGSVHAVRCVVAR